MRAAVVTAPETIHIQTVPMPDVPSGWSLIKCDYTGLCGTDFSILHGSHPRAKFPLIMGHEISGTVVKSTLDGPALGTRVTCEPLISCGECGPCKRGDGHVCRNLRLFGIDKPGSMSEYVALPNDRLIAIPEGVSLALAALTEPLAVAVHAVEMSPLAAGDAVAIFGAGPIGMLTALVARNSGASRVVIVEPSVERARVAESLGFETISSNANVTEALSARTNGEGFDVVFDAAAHPSVAELLASSVRPKGAIILVGIYKKPALVDLQALCFKEVSMTGVRVYTRRDVERAVDLIANDSLNLSSFPIDIYPLEETALAFEKAQAASGVLKVLVKAGEVL
ncbi:alcohol dehydrogenase [Agrobacterium sp. MS2]|nr:alcohol dehydrogenase [Agrobacterium sp. MS2]